MCPSSGELFQNDIWYISLCICHSVYVTLYMSLCTDDRLVCTPKLHTQVAVGCQPAATWVNTTRYCKYSQVFLAMGENIARNM